MKRQKTMKAQALHVAGTRGAVTGRDLEAVGIPRQYLQHLYEEGYLERVGRFLLMRHTVISRVRMVCSHGIPPYRNPNRFCCVRI